MKHLFLQKEGKKNMRKTKGGKTSTVVKDRYNKKVYDQFTFRMKKGYKSIVEEYSNKVGLSLNAFIAAAIMEKIDRIDAEAPTDPAEPESLD